MRCGISGWKGTCPSTGSSKSIKYNHSTKLIKLINMITQCLSNRKRERQRGCYRNPKTRRNKGLINWSLSRFLRKGMSMLQGNTHTNTVTKSKAPPLSDIYYWHLQVLSTANSQPRDLALLPRPLLLSVPCSLHFLFHFFFIFFCCNFDLFIN